MQRLENAAAAQPLLPARVTGLRLLGRGVAFTVEAEGLVQLRQVLADAWAEWLTPQDAQAFRPHVTIQNKVAPEVARVLFQQLEAEFVPFAAVIEGLGLWHYRGGPWQAAATFPFSDATGLDSKSLPLHRGPF